jgi:hypothetical protein
MVWDPAASTVIIPVPLFLIMYVFPFGAITPNTDGRFIVKVPEVASTK